MALPRGQDLLDIEQADQLVTYLRQSGRIAPTETPRVRVLAGGVSNKTVLVERASGEGWVLKQALAKLRVKVDWFSDPARIEREALGIRYLLDMAPRGAITPLIFEDRAVHLLAMQAVPQPHENFKAVLLEGRVEDSQCRQFGELLGTIHHQGWKRGAEIGKVFEDRSHFQTLRLEPYYQYTAAQAPEGAAFMNELVRTTLARRLTLVHGDYSPKNILIHAGRLVLLDHEVIHFGDPAFDLGFGMTHLLSKLHHCVEHRKSLRRAARVFWQAYGAALGEVPWKNDLEVHAVRHTLGCLLARVAGRSPLEYLSETERQTQRRVVLKLMASPPASVMALLEAFDQGVSS